MTDFLAQSLVGLLVILFLGFGLLLISLRTGKTLLRRLLGAFFIVFGLVVLDVYAQLSGFYVAHPRAAYWLNSLPLLFGPLIYLITRASLYEGYRMSRRDWLHLAPALLLLMVTVGAYHLQSGELQQEFFRRARRYDVWYNFAISLLVLGTMAWYLVLSLRSLTSYRREIAQQYSSLESKNLNWLSRLIYGFGGVVAFSLSVQLVAYSTANQEWIVWGCLLLAIALVGMIFYNVYRGLLESDLFAGLPQPSNADATPLSQANIALQSRIAEYLNANQSYLEPDLTLAELARRIDLKPRELSVAINNGMADNFFTLINGLRVAHAQELLRTSADDKLTVLEVMYASGFNSKSSFNTAFKRHTGKTPTQWRRAHVSPLRGRSTT